MRSITDRKNNILRVAAPLAFWFVVWQLAAMGVGQELLLPTPLAVCARLFTLARTGEFWLTAGASLLRIFGGMALGTLLGALLAWLTSFVTVCDYLLSPALRVIRATPVVSFIILVILWVSRAYVPAVSAALMVMPVVWGNVAKGFSEAPAELLELARAYRFSRGKTLRLVYLPSARPYFASAVQTAMGLAWKSGVAAEVLCLPRSAIGAQLYYSKLYLETPSLFAWTAVVIVLSFLLERALGALLKRRAGRW